MKKHTLQDLQYLQAMPLKLKVRMTQQRIREWIRAFGVDGVYVSFSGGKDSTVLMDICREMEPGIKAMFVDVPTQFPELRDFVKTYDNVDIIRPKNSFVEVCDKYGFPLISKEVSESVAGARKYLKSIQEEIGGGSTNLTDTSTTNSAEVENIKKLEMLLNERMKNRKGGNNQRLAIMLGWLTKSKDNPVQRNTPSENRSTFSLEHYKFLLEAPFEISNRCCGIFKKEPAHRYSKETGRNPITAQMASESRLRTQKWLQNGCNGFDLKIPTSNPMSFWTEQDVLLYIKNYIETPLTEAWENIYNPIRKKRKKARRALRRFNYRKTAICSVYGQVVSDDEEMGQIDFMQYTGLEIFDRGNQPLHCTGCQRTGCVCCGFGAHTPCDTRFMDLKESHPQMYKILDIAKNNGYTMRQAIHWLNEHGMNIKGV